jgi:hypothetical protein
MLNLRVIEVIVARSLYCQFVWIAEGVDRRWGVHLSGKAPPFVKADRFTGHQAAQDISRKRV